ncbi:hypothetical protein J1N35_002724 [Gossypium stocksii]|uniref:Uncharacterized protein n=1 Tax=Gossypium stocksii TaxID=47602 RepID=A0A9D3WN87_9ROSI|nr:hypothetical protein J1N35_002724 [Gossypium stocksii]
MKESAEHEGCDDGDPSIEPTKKARLRGFEESRDVDMETTKEARKPFSWKDRLIGTGLYQIEKSPNVAEAEEDEDFEL